VPEHVSAVCFVRSSERAVRVVIANVIMLVFISTNMRAKPGRAVVAFTRYTIIHL
jgi:hypothetical protein